TSGQNTGGIGLLKDGGRLDWPLVLRRPAFESDRERVNTLAPQAYKQAVESGRVDDETLQGLIDSVRNLNSLVSENIRDLSANDFSAARRYLRDLERTVRTLQDPNAGNYISRRWAPAGSTVSEIVAQMGRKGLRFAPAVAGDEGAYVAMHRALANYYAG